MIERFVAQYCAHRPVESVLTYPHPFTKGGMIIVFADDSSAWLEYLTAAYQLGPPLPLRCLRRRELPQLSLPGMFAPPLQVNERPHLPYWLQHRGQIWFGEDLRPDIRPFSPPHLLLAGHIEGCMDYLRRYGILTAMIHQQYAQLVGMLTREMCYLMATALLIHQVWDVSLATIPDLFAHYFADDALMDIWLELDAQPVETAVYDNAVHAAWLFEKSLQKLRRYAHVSDS